MNANRKADLQRKLALASVPKPPAGLAERIKSDIPKNLQFDATKERARMSSSVAFSMRVAASILVLISASYIALHLLSRASERKPAAVTSVVAGSHPAPRAESPRTTPESSRTT